jgi:prophage tail gpP-like protein
LQDLATKLLAPFGITAVFKTSPGDPFPSITVEPGQTVFQLLDKMARQRKILMYPSYDGNLVFAPQAESKAATALVQGVNILNGKATFDNTNRFSSYTTKGQNLAFLGTAAQGIGVQGKATDEGVTRYRPMILMAEHSLDDQKSEDRASYEAHLRAAKSLEVELQVQGWFQQDGTPWEINQLVRVDSGFLGVRRQMLVKKVTFNKSGSGTVTSLELTRNDAFLFASKVVKKEDPLGWTKFVK